MPDSCFVFPKQLGTGDDQQPKPGNSKAKVLRNQYSFSDGKQSKHYRLIERDNTQEPANMDYEIGTIIESFVTSHKI